MCSLDKKAYSEQDTSLDACFLVDDLSGWRYVHGFACGLGQSSLRGTIHCVGIDDVHIASLDDSMKQLLGSEYALHTAIDEATSNATKLTHRYLHWTGEIQRLFKIPVSHHYVANAVMTEDAGAVRFNVSLPTFNVQATLRTLEWLKKIINDRLKQSALTAQSEIPPCDLDILREQLKGFSEPGTNNFSIIQAALRLNIPIKRVTQNVFQLGVGKNSRWMDSTVTDSTPAISVAFARNKLTTASILRAAGLPGAQNIQVYSPDDALRAAHKIGYPVVVKPADLDQGIGVAADLRNDRSLLDAYSAARQYSQNILVEKWVKGYTHRITVIHGQAMRVSKRIAGGVTGDGLKTVRDLVNEIQAIQTSRQSERNFIKSIIELDSEACSLLEQQGLSPDYTPSKGEYIRLRRRDNMNAGGRSIACPINTVHADNLQLAIDATNILRLDIAGVDLITEDITKSWHDSSALICEINAKPQIVAPEIPFFYDQILKFLFPNGALIPAQLVLYPDDAKNIDCLLEKWIHSNTDHNGLSIRGGLWINGVRTSMPFPNGLVAAEALLSRKDVTGAICMMTPNELMQHGMPLSRWNTICLDEVISELNSNNQLAASLTDVLNIRQFF